MAEINAFYDWLVTNQLSSSAINLWHALMHVANISGWPDDFTVAISRLQSYTGCGRDAIYTARNQLKQKGRIEYRERSGNQSSVYRLIPLVSNNPTLAPMHPPTQVPTQSPTQQPNIIRLDYTRPDYFIFDGDDLKNSELARARELAVETVESGRNVESLNIPDELKAETAVLADFLFLHYFGRPATSHDAEVLFEVIRRGERQPDGSFIQHIDPDRAGVAEYAFRVASEDGACTWRYVRQVLTNLARRGLKTLDACERYDAQREFDKDNRR